MAIKKLFQLNKQKHTRIALIHLPPYVLNMPPLGIAYLASVLEKFGYPFKIFDLNVDYYYNYPEKQNFIKYCNSEMWCTKRDIEKNNVITEEIIDAWAEQILNFNPDIVGISLTDHSLIVSNMLSDKIKSKKPGINIIYGGPFCSGQSLQFRETTDSVDLYVTGEGEETLAEILLGFEKTGRILPCKGTITKKNGMIRDFGQRDKLDIDKIPYPDFSVFSLEKYFLKTFFPILLGRGCNFHCTFCSDCAIWGNNRARNPKSIAEEMKRDVKKYGACDFACNDLIVNSDLEKLEELSDIIVRKKLNVGFSGQGRIRNDMSDKLLKKLKDAGFRHFIIGIESGSQNVLDSMKKGITVKDTEQFLKRLSAQGITNYTLWMIGYPTESYLDFWKTIFFIIRNRHNMNGISSIAICSLHFQSELFIKKDELGIKIDKSWQWYKGSLNIAERRRREHLFRKILTPIVPFAENK